MILMLLREDLMGSDPLAFKVFAVAIFFLVICYCHMQSYRKMYFSGSIRRRMNVISGICVYGSYFFLGKKDK